ncbi:nitrogen fixation protein NifQ [Marinospirillum perlucidum]|uniref:nitrogen fixation protein NifQ n=1 Tax=Marinospirillum perlucidum TaxID=1982602 RepID=UPI000DF12B8A|nr:nitrogen fixation protein NifQ [Marinospirillum perlucidum]
MNAQVQPPRIQSLYSYWVGLSDGEINSIYLARMLAAQVAGHSVLSGTLGLPYEEFTRLMQQYFPGSSQLPDNHAEAAPVADIPESEGLIRLLLNYRAARDESEIWLAKILAQGCAGSEHLWYDLGLWSRDDLQALIRYNFPGLARKNHLEMKWKKFLYRQLCLDTGVTLCRSPSCQDCNEYEDCFGPE